MKVFLLLSQHLGLSQITELKEIAGGSFSVVSLPVDFLEFFNQVDPGRVFPLEKSHSIMSWLEEASSPGDLVVLHAEGGLSAFLLDGCRELGLRCVYSTSVRQALEQTHPDGKIFMRHVDVHRGFRDYPDSLHSADYLPRALVFAHRLHNTQMRKGTEIPYFSHLSEVLALIMTHAPRDLELQVAGLLHDAAEDMGGEVMLKKIRRRFGRRVADLVAFASDSLVENPGHKAPWAIRKQSFLNRLPQAPADALLLILCDKVANLRSIVHDLQEQGVKLWDRFNPEADHRWYYGSILKVMLNRRDLPRYLCQEMAYLVGKIKQ